MMKVSWKSEAIIARHLCDATARDMALMRDRIVELTAPIPMILTCPACVARHIDRGEFATKRHHTHACQNCGFVWRPAVVATVGVRFLPGFKDEV